ncbi:MAG: UDP-glucose 6-dehydrogenase [Anaerocolumna sp.]|jgi:UDPglucose 6-dehydrogenase|nr:UDP-glucose 6-dehydrogenase [Anaerocolumna sp.]
MKVAIVGTGYVGLVTGVLLSDFGNDVICVDTNKEKIELLNQGICPIYEPGLQEIIINSIKKERIQFTADIQYAVEESQVVFIAVGTPATANGSANLEYVYDVTKKIGQCVKDYKVIVNKSTVPVGTGQITKKIIQQELEVRGMEKIQFDVVSNPEFLREGTAIYDFRHPDRIVIGGESAKAINMMRDVYKALYINHAPFIECNIETAEMIKYTNNAFLAMKITFINEIANVCEKTGANVQEVAHALGKDGRISPKFLHAGPGYGGSCFPKDTKALIEIATQCGERVRLIEAVVKANEYQKLRMVDKIKDKLGYIHNKVICVLGITFKPETDDMRDAPSLVIIPELIKRGAKIKVYDPEGIKDGKIYFKDLLQDINFCKDEYEAIEDTDALVILTEWNLFRNLDIDKVKVKMRGKYFFDFRNIYNKEDIEAIGLKYTGVGV